MRFARLVLLFILVAFAKSAVAQQGTTSAPQATALLQQSLTALSGGHPLSDVTISGTVRRIAGSGDESGTTVLKALASGVARTDLAFPSGTLSEVLNSSAEPRAGAWSGPDGISHPIAFHNLFTTPAWFFPAFVMVQGLSGSGYVATYVGRETRNEQTVEHISFSQPMDKQYDSTGLFQHLSQVDIYLDSSTFLPSAIAYSVHPDNNGSLDIPVEVQFSDYRPTIVGQAPFHIQKFLNNTLLLDVQAQSVAVNTGLNATAFSIQ